MEHYTVQRIEATTPLTCDWADSAWASLPAVTLSHHMGTEPAHKPLVQAKLACSDRDLRVIFRVEDQYVRAQAATWHDAVCRDSCVELFFTPGQDVSKGYFNFEFNCCGVMLARFQPAPGEGLRDLSLEHCQAVTIERSLAQDRIDPEIAEPTTWTLAAAIPFDVLEAYCDTVVRPAKGATWRSNLYKCADKTSGPHWLTWSPIDWDGPNFHLPQFFGQLTFAD